MALSKVVACQGSFGRGMGSLACVVSGRRSGRGEFSPLGLVGSCGTKVEFAQLPKAALSAARQFRAAGRRVEPIVIRTGIEPMAPLGKSSRATSGIGGGRRRA